MRRCFTTAFLVLAAFYGLVPEPLRAQGLYLNWNDCATGPTATSNLGFACDQSSGESLLIAALASPQPVDSVLGMEIVVDVQHSSAVLPDWWAFDVGDCRDKSLHVDGNFSGFGSCGNPWPGLPSGGLFTYTVGQPYGGANQARILITLSVPSPEMMTFTANLIYYAARILIDHAKTAEGAVCPGCEGGACLVLNSITLRRPPRPVGTGDVVLDLPGPSMANWATWQSGSLSGCQAVPVRTRTWGAIKSLYR